MRLPTPANAAMKLHPALPGPSLIAIGVAILTAAVLWPAVPATSGAALVALGATGSLVNQLRRSPLLQPALAAHLFVYVSLYLVFVGAVVHVALNQAQDGLSFLQGLDLGMSAGVMTLAVRLGIGVIVRSSERGGGDAPAR